MRIEFEDFVPAIRKRGLLSREFEPLRDCLERANKWIETSQAEVIHVETVVLPNLWDEDGSEDEEISTSGDMFSQWNQFIRVWYRNPIARS